MLYGLNLHLFVLSGYFVRFLMAGLALAKLAPAQEGGTEGRISVGELKALAKTLQEEGQKVIRQNLTGTPLAKDLSQKGCPSQALAKGANGPEGWPKGCASSLKPLHSQKAAKGAIGASIGDTGIGDTGIKDTGVGDTSIKDTGASGTGTKGRGTRGTGTQILIFVSFSMPAASLKALSESSANHGMRAYNVILVMRGLYEDSFVKTAQKIQEMGIKVDINPELFDAYHIQTVPTFVKLKDGNPVGSLKGNVTLAFAAKALEEVP